MKHMCDSVVPILQCSVSHPHLQLMPSSLQTVDVDAASNMLYCYSSVVGNPPAPPTVVSLPPSPPPPPMTGNVDLSMNGNIIDYKYQGETAGPDWNGAISSTMASITGCNRGMFNMVTKVRQKHKLA